MRRRSGQVAMEYVMIFSVAFFLTLPLVILFFTQTAGMESDIAGAQLLKASQELIDAAEEVYYMGEPAKQTLYVTFPENIESVTVEQHSLHFVLSGPNRLYEHYTDTLVNLTGELGTYGGTHTVTVKVQGGIVNITDD